ADVMAGSGRELLEKGPVAQNVVAELDAWMGVDAGGAVVAVCCGSEPAASVAEGFRAARWRTWVGGPQRGVQFYCADASPVSGEVGDEFGRDAEPFGLDRSDRVDHDLAE